MGHGDSSSATRILRIGSDTRRGSCGSGPTRDADLADRVRHETRISRIGSDTRRGSRGSGPTRVADRADHANRPLAHRTAARLDGHGQPGSSRPTGECGSLANADRADHAGQRNADRADSDLDHETRIARIPLWITRRGSRGFRSGSRGADRADSDLDHETRIARTPIWVTERGSCESPLAPQSAARLDGHGQPGSLRPTGECAGSPDADLGSTRRESRRSRSLLPFQHRGTVSTVPPWLDLSLSPR